MRLPTQRMIESTLTEIAKELKVELGKKSHKVSTTPGSFTPIINYNLEFNYHTIPIKVICELGNHNIAVSQFKIELSMQHSNFIVDTRNHLIRILTLNKSPWKIKTNKKFVVRKLSKLLDTSGMTQLTKKQAFEPTIIGKMMDTHFLLEIKFYLGFTNKEDSIRPLINFNKSFIDYLQREYCGRDVQAD